jgi:hypothetical protein
MKNIKIVSFAACMTWMLSLVFFSACSNDDSASASGSGSAPVIEYVAPSGYNLDGSLKPLTPVRVGDPKNYYVIHGTGLLTTTKVYFNDFDTYFRPTFVTDTDIVILIDENTPYANGSNKLKVVTGKGTVFFDFVIKPPVPSFLQFYPINATAGQEVTITGKYFLNPVVTLAKTKTQPEVPVTVVSSTLEKIVIKVPENADLRYLTIANISGATNSTGLDFPAWNNFTYLTDGKAEQGTTYIAKDMDAWGSLQGNWGWFDKLAPYSGIRVAIKAKADGKVRLVFNGDWTNSPVVSVTTEWKTFYLPWSMFSSSDRVQNITFQNQTATAKGDGLPNTFYIDNIGFMLKAE